MVGAHRSSRRQGRADDDLNAHNRRAFTPRASPKAGKPADTRRTRAAAAYGGKHHNLTLRVYRASPGKCKRLADKIDKPSSSHVPFIGMCDVNVSIGTKQARSIRR